MNPDGDLSAILDALPAKYQRPFRADLDDAQGDVGQLRFLLHLWRLRAIAFSAPGFDEAATKARTARNEDLFPLPWERATENESREQERPSI